MEYRIIYIDLPCRINAITVMDESGFYNIYVNSKLDYESQQKAIKHELTHIVRDDLYRQDIPLEQVEII